MKRVLYVILFFVSILFGQAQDFKDIPQDLLEDLLKMDFRDSSLITPEEGRYLNVIFENSRKEFDFRGKRLASSQAAVVKSKAVKQLILEMKKIDIIVATLLMEEIFISLMRNKKKKLEVMTQPSSIGASCVFPKIESSKD